MWKDSETKSDYLNFDYLIDAVESIPGMKLTSDRQRYDYLKKGKTDFIAETLMLAFRRTKKRY